MNILSTFILGSGDREITLPQSKEFNNRLFKNWLYGIISDYTSRDNKSRFTSRQASITKHLRLRNF